MLDHRRNVCVIGAGTMGSGIAAHLANIGFHVTLLDLTPESARTAFERAKNTRPPHFYLPETANNIRLGSISQDLHWVSEADWVCEAVVEKLDVKKSLFEQIDPLLKSGAYVSTNTSGLQIGLLAEGRSEQFRKRFLGTHFFNPPRYLKLLELIPTDETDPAVVHEISSFLESAVARRVVTVKDTPGFIANRFGMWSMYWAVHVTEKLGLTIEEADAITGPFIGRPKTASFRLNDLVGLDIMQDIATNLVERCPHDPETRHLQNPSSLQYLLDQGWIGSKAGQGYYKKEAGQFLAFDLKAHGYRELQTPDFPSLKELERLPLAERLNAALELRDPVGDFLREYLLPSLRYAYSIREEVSHNVQDFDRVMQWGFGWEAGPFELIDMIGPERLGIQTSGPFYDAIMVQAHDGTYYHSIPGPEYRTVTEYPQLEGHEGFNVRDLGMGVTGICLKTKMGTINPNLVQGLTQWLNSNRGTRLVITSEGPVFSLGYDLRYFAEAAERQDWEGISSAIKELQTLNNLLREFPSVAAVFGYCVGGGFEVAAGCQAIVSHPEAQIGLPESKVGLIPGGAGTPLMRLRSQSDAKSMVATTKLLAFGHITSNTDEARKLGYLRARDVTCYHPDRVLYEAVSLAQTIDVQPLPEWQTVVGPYRGMVDQMQNELIARNELTDYDQQINDRVKHVFSCQSYEEALAKEHDEFLALVKEGLTQARMKHMLETRKPLRN